MPVQFLSAAERDRLSRFLGDVPQQDLVAYFHITEDERKIIKAQRGEPNRLGFAFQLCCLRYLGFFPANLLELPLPVVAHVAVQLELQPLCYSPLQQNPLIQKPYSLC